MIGGSLYGTGRLFEDITKKNALMAMRVRKQVQLLGL